MVEEQKKLDITVGDTGIGISEKDEEKIFERFYQSNSNLSSNTGFGIGLHLVKSLVELHKGNISVKNNLNGLKTIFNIKIPIEKTSYNKNELKISKKDDEMQPLLVDDLEDLWRGVVVIKISRPPSSQHFDLKAVLMWIMHGFPGYHNCSSKNSNYLSTPILFVTLIITINFIIIACFIF